MASISTNSKNGTRTIAVMLGKKDRRYVRLGKVSMKQAETAQGYIEDLAACLVTGTAPKKTTAEWVASLPETIRKRLERAGLVRGRERVQSLTLGGWLDAYFALRKDIKPRTVINFQRARRLLLGYFPADKPIDGITRGDAEDFSLWLRTGKKLSEGTARRDCKRAKQFFAAAVKRKMLSENPFDAIRCGNFAEDRFYFVSLEEARAVLDACPDAQWRLIFALARFGGLRVPSEILPLQWGDVNWEKMRLTIHSPKTEGYEGKGTRVVPIFPELLPHLLAAFEAAEPGQSFVITRYRSGNQNLRTQLLRIIGRAGLNSWPKLFVNLRSTRETELVERFPVHVVTAWLGNSPDIARRHYLQTTDEHFARAVSEAHQNPHQIPHQHGAAASRTESQGAGNPEPNPNDSSELCGSARPGATPYICNIVPPRGLEQSAFLHYSQEEGILCLEVRASDASHHAYLEVLLCSVLPS